MKPTKPEPTRPTTSTIPPKKLQPSKPASSPVAPCTAAKVVGVVAVVGFTVVVVVIVGVTAAGVEVVASTVLGSPMSGLAVSGLGLLVVMVDWASAGLESSLVVTGALGLVSSVSVLIPVELVVEWRGGVAWGAAEGAREAGALGSRMAGVAISALVVVVDGAGREVGAGEVGPAAGSRVAVPAGRGAEGTTMVASRMASRAEGQDMARMVVVSETIDFIKLQTSNHEKLAEITLTTQEGTPAYWPASSFSPTSLSSLLSSALSTSSSPPCSFAMWMQNSWWKEFKLEQEKRPAGTPCTL